MTISTSMVETCRWCGCWHTGTCGRIKAIEYYENGTIKRIELHDHAPSAPKEEG